MKTKYVMISEAELKIKEWELFMSEWQVQEVLEYWDTFKVFLKKKIHEIQANLANMKLIWKEQNAYIAINTIEDLIKSIDKTEEAYKEFKEKRN